MEARLSTLSELLPDKADSALIISGENRRYFTGFVSSLGYLLITRKQAYLLVDFRYSEAAKKNARGCEVVTFKKLSDSLREIIQCERLRSVMLEGSAFTLNEAANMEQIISSAGAAVIKSNELDNLIARMRIIKTANEVENIRTAQRITEEALSETLKLINDRITEKDLALELEYRMRKKGADGISFDLITISGKKTSMPHGVPGDEKLTPNSFITFDIGALYKGYHSDMTRTFAYGKTDDKKKRVYNTVLQAQRLGLEAVRDGATCHAVDAAARDYIYAAGFEGMFGHSTGHGVGLEIHEMPFVTPNNNYILRSGMVVTVEPGIYIPNEFGVRIEDTVVVSGNDYINLATFPKELIEL